MTSDMSYTAEEIAKMLKISKLTVYELIKKGELASYRVGKQMRVDAADLEAYKQRTRSAPRVAANQPPAADAPERPAFVSPQAAAPSGPRPIVITGQDISLDLLAKHMEKRIPGVRPLRAYVGSLDGLVAMYRGETDIVSTHLLDGDTGEYNLPYVRKLLIGSSYLVVHLLKRRAGLYVRQGNPLGIEHWRDLSRPGVRIVNRERGAGARVLLDEHLRLCGLKPQDVLGYDSEETNHMGVAGKVASGEADAGVGIEKAAAIVGGVDFIPLAQEQYDLVLMKKPDNREWMAGVLNILKSSAFRAELQAISGYDLSMTGEVLFET